MAKRMAAIFEGLNVKILVTIREQKSALFSLYQWYYTRRMISGSVDQWLRNCRMYSTYYGTTIQYPLLEYQFARLAVLYGQFFGAENVLVLPIEMLSQTPKLFYQRLEDFAGISRFWSTPACPDFPKENRSLGRLGVAYQRFFKGLDFAWKEYRGMEPVLSEALLSAPYHQRNMQWIAKFDRRMKPMSSASEQWIDN